jgi:hypothetical protein
MQGMRDVAGDVPAAQNSTASLTEASTTSGGRIIPSLQKVRNDINAVDHALTAMCDLLKASSQKIEAWSVYILLKPWQEQLTRASCDLNDHPC